MKKIISVCLLIICFLFMVSCSHIEDTDNTNNNLLTIKDENIIEGMSNVSTGRISSSKQSNDEYIGTIKVTKMSGVESIKSISGKGQKLIFNIKNTLETGNFEIVIVHNDVIIHNFGLNEESEFIIEEADGTYYLKIAGESAKFSLEYKINRVEK